MLKASMIPEENKTDNRRPLRLIDLYQPRGGKTKKEGSLKISYLRGTWLSLLTQFRQPFRTFRNIKERLYFIYVNFPSVVI